MPLWPFGRKKLRGDVAQPSSPEVEKATGTHDNHCPAINSRDITPRKPLTSTSLPRSPEDTPRKRRRSSEGHLHSFDTADQGEKIRQPRMRSREDITALPSARKMQTSPHLRSPASPAIPYASSPAPAGSRRALAQSTSPVAQPKRGKPPTRNPSAQQKRRLSKKQEYVDRAVREEEIRAMSAPVPIPKRQGGHGDMLRRDSKKARRTFSKKEHDHRSSTVSLPPPESMASSVSGGTDQRGWAVSALDVFNPRPAVKIADTNANTRNHGSSLGISRNGSRKEKLTALREDAGHKDRRRIAELADDMDAGDIRILLERDQKRREKKRQAEQEKLERTLLKRAEKQKNDDERRAREMGTPPPTALHPAFRSKTEEKKPAMADTTMGNAPPTPMSLRSDRETPEPPKGGTYLQYGPDKNPFDDPVESSPFVDPVPTVDVHGRNRAISDAPSATSFAMGSPSMETPLEDPVVETAQAVRVPPNRLSQLGTSPPRSPLTPTTGVAAMSPLRREYTPDLPAPPRPIKQDRSPSESSSKRTGTWASIFKRGTTSRPGDDTVPAKSETSFSNTSRESMSRQPIPVHLVGSVAKRHSVAPARTQSIFREDLPEMNNSARSVEPTSSSTATAAQNVPQDRQRFRSPFADPIATGRTDSPVDVGHANSAMALSTSLASIDSEASWLSGKPAGRSYSQSQMRGSVGSLTKRPNDFTGSFEDLGMPEDEFFRKLTPAADQHPSSAAQAHQTEDGLVRRDTNRRRPTLIQRDPRVRSREGLLDDFNGRESAATVENTQDEFKDTEESQDIPQEIIYGRGHARAISTGSAKLLDIPPSRTKSGRNSPDTRPPSSATPTTSPRL